MGRRARTGRIRYSFRATREGWLFILVTLGVGAAAVNTGNNLLFLVLGMLLSLLLLSGVMSEFALRGVRVERLLPARAFAGGTCLIEIAATNHKRRLSSYSLEVADVSRSEAAARRCYFLKLAPGDRKIASYRRTPGRRGPLAFEALRVSTRYPFGLIEKTRELPVPGELLVYPALLPGVDAQSLELLDEGDATTGAVGPGSEIAGVRAYRPGDEARNIHWRRTARLGSVVVREHERSGLRQLSIYVDNGSAHGAQGAAELELRISRAATLVPLALGRGIAVDIRTREGRAPRVLPGAPPDPLWRFLALVEPAVVAPEPRVASPVRADPARRGPVVTA